MSFLFEFVRQFSTDLAGLAERIEEKLFSEPHASLMQARLYSEHLVKLMSKEEELEVMYPLKHAERIHKLYRQNAIEEDIYAKLEWIRKKGNKAAHNVTEVEVADVLQAHKFLFEISVWYMQVYVTYDFEAPAYKLPVAKEAISLKGEHMDDVIKPYLDKKLDDMWAEVQQQLDDIRAEKEKLHDSDTNETTNVGVKTISIKEDIHKMFTQNHFILTNKTKKAAEYEHKINKEVVYLLPNKLVTIVIHPETAKKHFEVPDEPSHSTALRRFPKAIKNGKTPTNFGYSFKFKKDEELNEFLGKLSTV